VDDGSRVTGAASNPRPNPYVFFVGCPRSGTTLIQRLANAHPELAVVHELHWLPHAWEQRRGIAADGTVKPELADILLADRRFRKLKLAPDRVRELAAERTPYARLVSELFDLHGAVRGKRLVGEKTPGYVRRIATLHELWPRARIVHVIRDGRDVALSLTSWHRAERTLGRFPTWSEDRLVTSALFWEWNVRHGREAAALFGDRYHELRYEALVADADGECRKLCDFLDISYDAAMLLFHEGRTQDDPSLDAKQAWRPVTAGLRDWRTEFTPADISRFESAAGALLEELGYDVGAAPTDADVERADRLREAFARGARARGWRNPSAWERVVG
jgi:Sulfotransferase family